MLRSIARSTSAPSHILSRALISERLLSTAAAAEQPSGRVLTDITSDGIFHVTLNRPDKLNALDMGMFEAIAETAADIRTDRSIRAVILRGDGRGFCSGLDVKSIGKSQNALKRLLERPSGHGPYDGESDFKSGKPVGNLAQDVALLWREIPAPVIACLHGVCFGAGLQIALGADFRYATPDCKLSIMEAKWGLVPDMSASITLRELVRIDVAKELTMTGRIISGEEAGTLGLVTRVCEDPFEEAENMAKEILQRSPDAVAASKALFQETWSNSNQADCLDKETVAQMKLLPSAWGLPSWNQMAATGRAFGVKVPYVSRK